MKRGTIIIVCFLVLILLSIGAGALSMNAKDSYQKQETAIVRIYGDIREPITKGHVNFFRGHVSIPLEYDVQKMGNDYYLWFITSNIEGNYSFNINNIASYSNGAIQRVNIEKNYTVGNTTSDYYINPGAIVSNSDFSIKLFLNNDNAQSISISYPGKNSEMISPGENTIIFSLNSVKLTQIITIGVGKYNVPAYLIISGSQNNSQTGNTTNQTIINQTMQNYTFNVSFSPKKIERFEQINNNLSYPIEIFNNVNADFENVTIIFNPKIFLLTGEINKLNANKSAFFNLGIITNESFREIIFVNYKNYSYQLPVEITFRKNTTINLTNGNLYDCVNEIQGKICAPEEVCTLGSVPSRQGICCKGSCAVKPASAGGSWIGWLIALVILGIIGYLFFKFKNVKSTKNPIERQVQEIESKEKLMRRPVDIDKNQGKNLNKKS
ncbi:hypothetical protein J4217_02300 [Candidatus Pacearchaeota archaeon]|nr:hypothetical protein [Candidatus Pacearchaeota archaeon]